MAEINEKVMAFVKETLDKSPKISLDELFERAKELSDDVAELSKRQFNARYPLQVKRRLAQATRGKGSGRKTSAAAKEALPEAPRGEGRSLQGRHPPGSPALRRGSGRSRREEGPGEGPGRCRPLRGRGLQRDGEGVGGSNPRQESTGSAG
jgi:hypothetical protein